MLSEVHPASGAADRRGRLREGNDARGRVGVEQVGQDGGVGLGRGGVPRAHGASRRGYHTSAWRLTGIEAGARSDAVRRGQPGSAGRLVSHLDREIVVAELIRVEASSQLLPATFDRSERLLQDHLEVGELRVDVVLGLEADLAGVLA
jgi:hypothetical protein